MWARLVVFGICLSLALESIPASAQSISEIYRVTDAVTRTRSEFHQVSISRGQEYTLADLPGPGKITYFYITDDTVGRWYEGLVLKIFWDDATNASVNVPLADFFGALGSKTVEYQSAAMQINHACFMSYLPMPFSANARIVLANDGSRDYSQKIAYGIDWEKGLAYAQEKSRLHAEWRRSNPVEKGLHTILDVQGRGQYVGGFLQVTSRNSGIWFGEGDTVFTVDGEAMTHSPGTEDEYGSCWKDPHWRTFSHLYSGHILNEKGVNRMYRWYLTNPVRFQHSLKVQIQNQHDNGTPTTTDADDYTTIAFWYQEGAGQTVSLPSSAVRTAPSFSTQSKKTE